MSRRRYALKITGQADWLHSVGRGLASAALPGSHSPRCGGKYHPVPRGWMVHAVHPVGAAARTMAVGRGLRHLRMALGTMGDFAPCAARVFRPLRRATGALPLDPRIFSRKNSVKAFSFGFYLTFWGSTTTMES